MPYSLKIKNTEKGEGIENLKKKKKGQSLIKAANQINS